MLEPLGETPRAPGEPRDVEWQLSVVPGLDTDRILALDADARLRQLEAFFLVRGAGSVGSARVALAGRMQCEGQTQDVAAQASVPSGGEPTAQVVAAFQQALDEVTRALLDQVGESIAAS